MASDCDRTVRIIKPDAEAILTNAVKCYFELGCSCENGVEFVGLHQNGDIAVVFSNPSGLLYAYIIHDKCYQSMILCPSWLLYAYTIHDKCVISLYLFGL